MGILDNQNVAPRLGHKSVRRAAAKIKQLSSHFKGPRLLFGLVPVAAIGLVIALSLGSTATRPNPNQEKPEGATTSFGAGLAQENRAKDITHLVADGETISEIAYRYDLDYLTLAAYNHIDDPNRLKPGSSLVIPSIRNESEFQKNDKAVGAPAPVPASARTKAVPMQKIAIEAHQEFDGAAITAHFSIPNPPKDGLVAYQWDLGNGRLGFRDNAFWTYSEAGTYPVSLTARDATGKVYQSEKLIIDVPYPTSFRNDNHQFLSLKDVNDVLEVPGEIAEVWGYKSVTDAPLTNLGLEDAKTQYRFTSPGFFNLTVKNGEASQKVFVFVSPMPTKHVDRADINWYRTQFNTGSVSNCGPSVSSMGVAWATGEYVPVSAIRQQIGWRGNGATSLEEIRQAMVQHNVATTYTAVRSAQDIFDIIDRGDIGVLLFRTGMIRPTAGSPLQNLIGRYYTDVVGHYVIVKGYSLDKKYIVVYDPIPSDWASNNVRYGDGVSMMGRNRYYPVNEMLAALSTASALEIAHK